MIGGKDPKSPATTTDVYDHMLPSWAKIDTVLGGTEAIRKAGKRYLPQHEREKNGRYDERLAGTTLYNVTKLTLESWVGRPFGDPIEPVQVPAPIMAILPDIDMSGNDLHVFCRQWFREGVAKAMSHVYVDFPRVEAGATRSLADDRAANLRPYWVHIRPEQLFFADAMNAGGREVLSEIRILEEEYVRDGFSMKCAPQIRRVFLDESGVCQIEIWRPMPAKKKADKPVWERVDAYATSLDRIPLVTFYADKAGFMDGKPPLEDLADLNIRHWQSTSDQVAILTAARFPILAISGGADPSGKGITIGPYGYIELPDKDAKAYYVEHTGAAIASGAEDLKTVEAQMADYGAQFLRKRPGNPTATARALDSAEATSPLQDMVLRFADAVAQALDLTARWMRLPSGGSVMLATDWGPEEVDQAELATIQRTREMRDISRVAYLEELKRRGIMSDAYDAEKDAALLEQETMAVFGAPPAAGSIGDQSAA